MAKTKLEIVKDGFDGGPLGFQMRDITFSKTENEVLDGFLSPSINDSDQYKLLVWPRKIKNVGTESMVILDDQKKALVNSGIQVVKNLWYLVLKDSNGVEIIREKQDGIIGNLNPGEGGGNEALMIDGGQYLNISGIPFGFYEIGIAVDPDENWSSGNEPAFVKFQYKLGSVQPINAFPAIPAQDIKALGLQIQDLDRRIQLLERGGVNP